MNSLLFEDVSIQLAREFGSATPDHRANVRAAIRASVHEQDFGVSHELLKPLDDFSKPPRLGGWALSISHCPTIGGFALKRSTSYLGFDLEVASRVTPKIAERIAAFALEKQLVADLIQRDLPCAVLWAAKESAIKAFGNRDPELKPHFGIVEIKDFDLSKMSFVALCEGVRAEGCAFAVGESDLSLSRTIAKNTEIIAALTQI